jgi:hypothetical protein
VAELATKELSNLMEQRERLIDAVIDERISKEIYNERLERLDHRIAVAKMAVHDASVEELEITHSSTSQTEC